MVKLEILRENIVVFRFEFGLLCIFFYKYIYVGESGICVIFRWNI